MRRRYFCTAFFNREVESLGGPLAMAMDPSQMMILVVGKWDEIYEGDIDNRASMADFFGGEVDHMPLRDPMTLEPMPETAGGE